MVSLNKAHKILPAQSKDFFQFPSINQSTENAKEIDKNQTIREPPSESFSFVDRLRYERLARIHRNAYLNQKKLVFIHNPRTGGQSFATLAYGRSLGHLTASKIKTAISNDEYENRISIGFVRDPVERLISAYNFSRQGGTTIIKQNRFKRVPRWALERFDIFCREWLFKEKKEKLDLVFRSQYLWFFDENEKLIVNQIYDISMLAEATTMYFGNSVILPRKNESCATGHSLETTPKSLVADIRAYYAIDTKLITPYIKNK